MMSGAQPCSTRAVIAALVLAAAIACASAVAPSGAYVIPQRQDNDCIAAGLTVPAAGLFPASLITTTQTNPSTTVQVVQATFFNVTYYSTYKVVRNSAIISGQNVNETYVLYQCGTARPDASLLPSGAKVFQIPLQSISVPDTSAVAFMDALNILDRVAFVTSYVDQPCMQALSGGDCNQVTLWSGDKNLTALGVPAVLNFGADPTNPAAIAFSATADPGPLNRAEWLKFVALFFNKEPEANKLYNTISQTYKAIAAAATATAPATRKVVAWIQWWPNATYGSPCTNAEGAISFNYPTYKVYLSQDAGGRIMNLTDLQSYVDAKQAIVGPSKVWLCANRSDVLRQILAAADVVVDEARYFYNDTYGISDDQITVSTFLTQYGLNSSDVTTLNFLKTNSLLREDGRTNTKSYNEWFERVVLRPDQVLADLISVVNPAALQQSSLANSLSTVQTTTPYFLRNLGRNQVSQVQSASSCRSLSGCRYTPAAICPFVYKACNGSTVYSSDTQRCGVTCNTPLTAAASPPPPQGTSPSPSPSQALATARPLSLAVLGAVMLAMMLLA